MCGLGSLAHKSSDTMSLGIYTIKDINSKDINYKKEFFRAHVGPGHTFKHKDASGGACNRATGIKPNCGAI